MGKRKSGGTADAIATYVDEYSQLMADISTMRERADRLRELIAKMEELDGIDPTSPQSALSEVATTRVDLVIDILRESTKPLSNQEVKAKAAGRGWNLSNKQVASALSYLRNKGTAEPVGRGVWRLTG